MSISWYDGIVGFLESGSQSTRLAPTVSSILLCRCTARTRTTESRVNHDWCRRRVLEVIIRICGVLLIPAFSPSLTLTCIHIQMTRCIQLHPNADCNNGKTLLVTRMHHCRQTCRCRPRDSFAGTGRCQFSRLLQVHANVAQIQLGCHFRK